MLLRSTFVDKTFSDVGKSNNITLQMNVANNTVKTHIYSAFQKSYGTRLKELRKLSPALLHFKINI